MNPIHSQTKTISALVFHELVPKYEDIEWMPQFIKISLLLSSLLTIISFVTNSIGILPNNSHK